MSRPWAQAWAEALYGPDGLYRTPGAAARHFRTSVMASRRLAAAVHTLAVAVDAALGRPDGFTVVDLGAGDGSLATELRQLAEPRWHVVAVDVAGRPAGVPAEVDWVDRLPERLIGFVVAHEWLDDLPVPVLARSAAEDGRSTDTAVLTHSANEDIGSTDTAVLQAGEDRGSDDTAVLTRSAGEDSRSTDAAARTTGNPATDPAHERDGAHPERLATHDADRSPGDVPGAGTAESDATDAATLRTVLVDDAGRERLGAPAEPADVAWARRWWPAGDRVEVGRSRDDAWAGVISALDRGAALAIDYSHTLGSRPAGGTLTGYRNGRQVAPVPDGRTNLTAHVALDAVAEAGRRAGARGTWTATQREALAVLLAPAPRPDLALASQDPRGYLRALAARGEDAELRDPAGLGSFGWLLQTCGLDLPQLVTEPGDRAHGDQGHAVRGREAAGRET